MISLPCVLFFGSGATALVFETLWFHQAGLSLGNTVWASSVVLSAFMAGLALGNAVAARLAERAPRPLVAYAILEAVIAVSGVALVYALPQTVAVVETLVGPWIDQPLALAGSRALFAFIALLVPATAMGGSLPLLARVLAEHDDNFGRVIGRLYGWNTLGAVVGAVLGPLWLLELHGVRSSAWVAGGFNLAIAGASLLLARGRPSRRPSARAPKVAWPVPAKWLLAAAAVSGALMLALEVLWFRLCILFVLPDSFAFALMLATILTGIAFGSLFAGRVTVDDDHLPLTLMLTGVAGLASYAGLEWWVGSRLGVINTEAAEILHLAIALMFPTAFGSGMCFTWTGRALSRYLDGPERRSGWLIWANTSGAVLGAALLGPGLLIAFGIEDGLITACGLYCVAAVCCARAVGVRHWWHLCVGVALLGVLAFAGRGRLQSDYLLPGLERYETREGAHLVEYREGIGETSMLLETRVHGQHRYHRLVTNSHSMSASAIESRRYMQAFVYLPLALHPEARDALLISYGVGSTAHALTRSPDLERIDIVDPSREILQLSRRALPVDDHPLDDPRVNVHYEGGRFYLQASRRRYDLITGEPPPPKSAGIVNLFTREYFEVMHAALNEGGIASYWLPVHSLEVEESLAILRSFCGVFEDCTLWSGSGLDLIMLGSRGEREPVNQHAFARQWRHPPTASQLADLGIEHPAQLGAMFVADSDRLSKWTREVAPLDDDHPGRLSRRAPAVAEVLPQYRAWLDVDAARETFASSPWVSNHWPAAWREPSLQAFDFQGDIVALTTGGSPDLVTRLVRARRVLQSSPLRTLVHWWLGSNAHSQRAAEDARGRGEGIENPGVMYERAVLALGRREFGEAAAMARGLWRAGTRNPQILGLGLLAHCMAGQSDDARRWLEIATRRGGETEARLMRFLSTGCGPEGGDSR